MSESVMGAAYQWADSLSLADKRSEPITFAVTEEEWNTFGVGTRRPSDSAHLLGVRIYPVIVDNPTNSVLYKFYTTKVQIMSPHTGTLVELVIPRYLLDSLPVPRCKHCGESIGKYGNVWKHEATGYQNCHYTAEPADD